MILIRTRFSPEGVFGELTTDSSDHVAYTLEHSYNDLPKIAAGAYICVRGQHCLHAGPIETFEVTGVEGRTGLLFHPGNTQQDSEGCILLGTSISQDSLTESRKAFASFMTSLEGVNTFTLQVLP